MYLNINQLTKNIAKTPKGKTMLPTTRRIHLGPKRSRNASGVINVIKRKAFYLKAVELRTNLLNMPGVYSVKLRFNFLFHPFPGFTLD